MDIRSQRYGTYLTLAILLLGFSLARGAEEAAPAAPAMDNSYSANECQESPKVPEVEAEGDCSGGADIMLKIAAGMVNARWDENSECFRIISPGRLAAIVAGCGGAAAATGELAFPGCVYYSVTASLGLKGLHCLIEGAVDGASLGKETKEQVKEKLETFFTTVELKHVVQEAAEYPHLHAHEQEEVANSMVGKIRDILAGVYSVGAPEVLIPLYAMIRASSDNLEPVKKALSAGQCDYEAAQSLAPIQANTKVLLTRAQAYRAADEHEKKCLEQELNKLSDKSFGRQDRIAALETEINNLAPALKTLEKELEESGELCKQANELNRLRNEYIALRRKGYGAVQDRQCEEAKKALADIRGLEQKTCGAGLDKTGWNNWFARQVDDCTDQEVAKSSGARYANGLCDPSDPKCCDPGETEPEQPLSPAEQMTREGMKYGHPELNKMGLPKCNGVNLCLNGPAFTPPQTRAKIVLLLDKNEIAELHADSLQDCEIKCSGDSRCLGIFFRSYECFYSNNAQSADDLSKLSRESWQSNEKNCRMFSVRGEPQYLEEPRALAFNCDVTEDKCGTPAGVIDNRKQPPPSIDLCASGMEFTPLQVGAYTAGDNEPNYALIHTKNIKECQAACAADSRCRHYSWYSDDCKRFLNQRNHLSASPQEVQQSSNCNLSETGALGTADPAKRCWVDALKCSGSAITDSRK